MRKIRTALVIALVGLVAFVLFVCYWLPPREPVHGGRSLTAWLRDLESGDSAVRDQAVVAVRAMGTNAIPNLLRMLSYKNSPLERQLLRLTRGQRFVRLPILVEEDCRERAAHAFLVLGATAGPAVPALVQALNNGDTAEYAAWVLDRIEDDPKPYLLQALTNQDPRVRTAACTIMQQHASLVLRLEAPVRSTSNKGIVLVRPFVNLIFGSPSAFLNVEGKGYEIPKFIEALESTEVQRRIFAAHVLGQFGSSASNSIPALRKAMNDPNAILQETARAALQQIEGRAGIP